MAEFEKWFEEEKKETDALATQIKKDRAVFHCKVCAESFPASEKALCAYCKVPICADCDSLSFCLNCYINLHDSVQVQLKLTKTLAWAVPLLLGVITWFDLALWIFGVIGMFGFFAGMHFFIRYLIVHNPEKYISPHWRKITDSLDYKAFIQENKPLKVNTFFAITPDDLPLREKVNVKENLKKSSPHPYSPEHIEKMEPPAYLDENFGLWLEQEITKKIDEENKLSLPKDMSLEDVKRELSRLRGKSCPTCTEDLDLGGICFTCHTKICPECAAPTNFVAGKCVCGYKFIPLQALFKTPPAPRDQPPIEEDRVDNED